MKISPLVSSILVLVLLTFSCSSTGNDEIDLDQMESGTIPPDIQEIMQSLSATQAQGLAGASIEIHNAYNYEGFSLIQPIEGAKLAAIDLSISDYSTGIDLDDVEIIDGTTDENFGSDPFIWYLMYDGEPFEDNFPTYKFGEPIRVLLIYAVRESTTSIKLQYWGSLIISEPILLDEKGLALPEP